MIIGGGFSGSVLAAQLLAENDVRVLLFERMASQQGRGLAYSSHHADHVLNVRAGNMSAFADRPGHFAEWLRNTGAGDGSGFITRTTYGRYLQDIIAQATTGRSDRFETRLEEVVSLHPSLQGVRVETKGGAVVDADIAVLAVGNLPPHDPPGPWWPQLGPERYQQDPWRPATPIGKGSAVVLLGTGLTAIDVALRLDTVGHAGPIIALSRRGLRPHRHRDGLAPLTPVGTRPASALSGMVRWAREGAARHDWRVVVDSLRGLTPILWASLDLAARRRFLRHLRPYWDIHRHRLAPQVADRVDALVDRGILSFAGGTIVDVVPDGNGVTLHYRQRGTETRHEICAARIINCTGPQGDLARSDEPLLRNLLTAGHIRADALNIGIDIDRYGQAVGRGGEPTPNLYALGPMTRGAWWEAVAVPDIRTQASMLARRLCNAHWVGGEGL